MNQNRQQNAQSNLKTSRFYLGSKERYITISSNFDSGNVKVVRQLSEFQYKLECFEDGTFTNKCVNSKSWFFFKVKGFPKNTKGKFFVSKVQALSSIFYSKYQKCYKPVYRVNGYQWLRFSNQIPITINQNGELQCTLEYNFKNQEEEVEFAFCYPYQYKQHLQYMHSLNRFENDPQLYFYKEILTYSPQKRPIHLLTITSQNETDKEKQEQEVFNPLLFPDKVRPKKFNKQIILITARVHSGQTPASYAMEGVINFLLDKQDLRAHILRKMFLFMIVPMINVDGVYHGHFRMDIFGKNLNRFYINPSFQLHPAVFAIKQLANNLTKQNRLSFYFDLHGHNAKKGCFIYGNAFSDFVEQVQSQVFCKLFSMNHPGFEYQYCNFTQKHMNAKDRFEDLTKQGCGRVVMHKIANIIHSYSVQCGILSPNNQNAIEQASNQEFKINEKGFICDPIEQNATEGQRLYDNSLLFTQDSYRNLGKNLLVSILDVFDKNPYSRVYNSRYKNLEMLRRLTAFEIFHSAERFRMFERFIFGKVKNINTLIQQILSSKIHYKQLYNCYFTDDQQFKEVDWPKNIIGLTKIAKNDNLKLKRFKSISQTKIVVTDQFLKMKGDELGKLKEVEETIQLKQQYRINQPVIASIELKNVEQIIERNEKQESQSYNQCINQDQSDGSQMEQTEVNHQILLMCQDQKQENQIITKIMHDDFNEKDYEKIEEKYKYKTNSQQIIQKQPSISLSQTENTAKKYSKNQILRDYSSTKNKYRVSRKLFIGNTNQINSRHKNKQLTILKNDGSDHQDSQQDGQVKDGKKLTAAQEFRRNIYDAIKQEIKEGLRRQHERKKNKEKVQNRLIESFRMKNNNRIKVNHNFTDIKRAKSKVRLPSLGPNIYIITTSTKLINKV